MSTSSLHEVDDDDWQVDEKPKMREKSAYKKCHNCDIKFSRIKSSKTSFRHHCRMCGEMFCQRCIKKTAVPSKYWKTKKKEKMSTVCYACYYVALTARVEKGKADIKHTESFKKIPAAERFIKHSGPARFRSPSAPMVRPKPLLQQKPPIPPGGPGGQRPPIPPGGPGGVPGRGRAETVMPDGSSKSGRSDYPSQTTSRSKDNSAFTGTEDFTDMRYARPFGYGVDLAVLQKKKAERNKENKPSPVRKRKVTLSELTPQNTPKERLDPEQEMREQLPGLLKQMTFVRSLQLSDAQIDMLAQKFRYTTAAKGEAIYREGDIANAQDEEIYIVFKGEFTASVKQDDRSFKKIGNRNLKSGDWFGELAVTCEIFPRAVTIESVTDDGELCIISNEDFKEFLKLSTNRDATTELKAAHIVPLFRDLGIYLFDKLTDSQLVDLADMCEVQELLAGEKLYSKDDLMMGLDYVILGELVSGESRIKSGQYFGEKSLIVTQMCPFEIKASTRTLVLQIDGQSFCAAFALWGQLESYSTLALQIAQHEVQLLPVISHSMGHEFFDGFLADAWSDRHLRFFEEVGKFRALPAEKMDMEAANISARFLESTAPDQVNIIIGIRRKAIKKCLDTPVSSDVFTPALSAVMELMSQDFLVEFKKQQDFANLLTAVGRHVFPNQSTMLPHQFLLHGGKATRDILSSSTRRLESRLA